MTDTPRNQLARYAALVWDIGDLIEVRALAAERDKGPLPQSLFLRAGDIGNAFDRLNALNTSGLNVYAGVLPRNADGGKTDADCLPGLVVWADFDGVDPREAWRRTEKAAMPTPSLVVNSGHGAHLYWRLTEKVGPQDISALVGDVAALLGSDSSVRNPSRILRVPGFKNLKLPPADCVLVFSDPNARYSFAGLRAKVPTPTTAPIAPTTLKATGGDMVERARRYCAMIPGSTEGGRSNAAYRAACALVNDFDLGDGDAYTLLDGWNRAANSPPLDSRELRSIFDSAKDHAKKPRGSKLTPTVPREEARHISTAGTQGDLSAMTGEIEAQARGERQTLALPWPRLSTLSHALRPGTVCVLAGPSGVGKSFLTLSVALAVHRQEVGLRYLPLEDRRVDLQFRILALLAGDYRMIDEDAEGVERRKAALAEHQFALEALLPFICENPRVGCKGANGKTIVPPLPYTAVLEWIGESAKIARVVFVDPISQIEFDQADQWRAEGDFIRKTLALASDSGATVVLVAHTVKRMGKNATAPLTLEDVQGSAAIGRLCHCALLLDAHDEKTSTVYRVGGATESVTHNRTVLVAKARNGSGARQRLAFRQSDTAPTFEELGVIAPRVVAVDRDVSVHWADRV